MSMHKSVEWGVESSLVGRGGPGSLWSGLQGIVFLVRLGTVFGLNWHCIRETAVSLIQCQFSPNTVPRRRRNTLPCRPTPKLAGQTLTLRSCPPLAC